MINLGTWTYLVDLVENYIKIHSKLYFLSGPIYDADGDGVYDFPTKTVETQDTT